MTYDPKKTRAKKDQEAVVDEILDDEAKKVKKAASKKDSTKKSDQVELKIVKDEEEMAEIHPNKDTPLSAQPQVWIALAASALVALLIIKKRRKK